VSTRGTSATGSDVVFELHPGALQKRRRHRRRPAAEQLLPADTIASRSPDDSVALSMGSRSPGYFSAAVGAHRDEPNFLRRVFLVQKFQQLLPGETAGHENFPFFRLFRCGSCAQQVFPGDNATLRCFSIKLLFGCASVRIYVYRPKPPLFRLRAIRVIRHATGVPRRYRDPFSSFMCYPAAL